MVEVLVLISVLLQLFSAVPYILDIIRGVTKPNIVTWFTWTLLTGISGSAALVSGEWKTAVFLYAGSACTALVVVLGFKYGYVKFTRFDIFCQVAALAGLVFWLVFNSPTIGILVPLGVDVIAFLPTLRHAWLKPGEETWQAFFIGAIAPVFTIVALTSYSIASLVFPLYLLLANCLIVGIILYQRKRQGISLGRLDLRLSS